MIRVWTLSGKSYDAEFNFTDAIGIQLKKKEASKPFLYIPWSRIDVIELNL